MVRVMVYRNTANFLNNDQEANSEGESNDGNKEELPPRSEIFIALDKGLGWFEAQREYIVIPQNGISMRRRTYVI